MQTAVKRPRGKPFVKGNDPRRNPSGRPKGRSITALLREELDKVAAGGTATNNERVAAMLVTLAVGGDLAAIREVLDRTEGKSVARTETGDPGAFEELDSKSTEELRAMLVAVK
jgi:hypothetical protein